MLVLGHSYLQKNVSLTYIQSSDSIGVSGLKDGFYTFAGAEIEKKDGKVFQNKTNTLAGSIVTMYQNISKSN